MSRLIFAAVALNVLAALVSAAPSGAHRKAETRDLKIDFGAGLADNAVFADSIRTISDYLAGNVYLQNVGTKAYLYYAANPQTIIPSLTDKSVMRLSNYTVNEGTRIEPVDSDSKCLSAQWNATMGVDWAATMYACQEGVSTVAHDTNKQAWNFVPVNGSAHTYYILPENHLMDMATRALSAQGLETYGGYMSTTMDLWNKTDSEQMWLVAPISPTS